MSTYQNTLSDQIKMSARGFFVFYRRMNIAGKISFLTVLTIIGAAIAAPFVAPYDPTEQYLAYSRMGPSMRNPLGTDLFGRDILSRIIYGGRVSLLVGVFAVSIAVSIGVTAGSIAGFVGGVTDETIMRIMDLIMSFPALVLALAIIGIFGPSLRNLVLVIGIVYSPQYARLIRGEVLSVKENEYVEAAKNTGLKKWKILVKHILPNSIAPVVVQATFHVATAIIFEASLSFLGLGVQPPTPSWGRMIADGRAFLPGEWWISTFAGLAIVVTVLSFNVLGDSLQDELDPKSSAEAGADA